MEIWNVMLGAGASASGEAGSQSMLPTLITFGLIFVVFYFLIIRPQSKRQKDTQKMLQALKKGDRVQTIGGIHGTVQSVKDQTIILRVANNVSLEFVKNAVSTLVSQGDSSEGNDAPVTEQIAESSETTTTQAPSKKSTASNKQTNNKKK